MASGLPQLDVVGYLVACRIAAFWRVSGCLLCASQGAWVPRVVRGESIGNLGPVISGAWNSSIFGRFIPTRLAVGAPFVLPMSYENRILAAFAS
jgi:hypothetical protein